MVFARNVLLAVGLGGCGLVPQGAVAQTLTVSATASLGPVLKTLGSRYEAARSGAKVVLNVAASGVLLQQIAQGAPVDVFISADEDTWARGVALKLLEPSSRKDVASNELVLVVPAVGGPALTAATALNGLATDAVQRIALGKLATVPAGRYAQQALQSARLWGALEAKLVWGDSVRQVLDYVARGEADAGFVYATDAALAPGKVKVVARITGHAPVRYPAALVSGAPQPAAAADFVAFLLSPPAQAVLAQAGFGKP